MGGTMGFGLPSAIGAKVASPEKIVVDIDGDASFSMTMAELATASQYSIGYAHTRMTNPDFVALAKAMGVHAIRCETTEELPAKMKEFMEYDNSKPVVFECRVHTNEHVYPMVPAGNALHQMTLHPQPREPTK